MKPTRLICICHNLCASVLSPTPVMASVCSGEALAVACHLAKVAYEYILHVFIALMCNRN